MWKGIGEWGSWKGRGARAVEPEVSKPKGGSGAIVWCTVKKMINGQCHRYVPYEIRPR